MRIWLAVRAAGPDADAAIYAIFTFGRTKSRRLPTNLRNQAAALQRSSANRRTEADSTTLFPWSALPEPLQPAQREDLRIPTCHCSGTSLGDSAKSPIFGSVLARGRGRWMTGAPTATFELCIC